MSDSRVQWVPFEKLEPNPENFIRVDQLPSLYRSIKAYGYLDPLVARRDGEYWRIESGHQRWRVMVDNEDIQRANGGLLPVMEVGQKTEVS